MTSFRGLLALPAAMVFSVAVGAGPASAWTLSASGLPNDRVVTFTAAPGEPSQPSVQRVGNGGDMLRFHDDAGTPSSKGVDCSATPELQVAQCMAVGTVGVAFKFGDGKDDFTSPGIVPFISHTDIDGGGGNDILTNGLDGGTLSGGSGSDILRPGPGTDTVQGGPGLDAVDYSERVAPVTVNLQPVNGKLAAVNGEEGENDAVKSDIEGIFGGVGDDTLTGGSVDEQFIPGRGRDTVKMNDGDDVVDARDGEQDVIFCGHGSDVVFADMIDTVFIDCDTVKRGGAGANLPASNNPGPSGPSGPPAFPSESVK